MKSLALGVVLTIAPGIVYAAPRGLPAQILKGIVQVVSVGGVETPARKAIAIGDQRFEVVGARDVVESLFASAGHYVEVEGHVTQMMYIGGEGYPLLTVYTVRDLDISPKPGALSIRINRPIGTDPTTPEVPERLDPTFSDILHLPASAPLNFDVELETEGARSAFLGYLAQLSASGEKVKGEVQEGRIHVTAPARVLGEVASRADVRAIKVARR